jgi:hypothetical protein
VETADAGVKSRRKTAKDAGITVFDRAFAGGHIAMSGLRAGGGGAG